MKKDRNTFFQESGFYNQTNIPTPMIANQPYIQQAQQSFYAGPGIQPNYNMPNPQMQNFNQQNPTDYSEIEARLSKIERNLNRIDARITKLENQNFYSIDDNLDSNNMYMV